MGRAARDSEAAGGGRRCWRRGFTIGVDDGIGRGKANFTRGSGSVVVFLRAAAAAAAAPRAIRGLAAVRTIIIR